MCKIGQCKWRRVTSQRLFRCAYCTNYITDRDIAANPGKYATSCYITSVYGGPADGDVISLPFHVRRFWIDGYNSIRIYEYKTDTEHTYCLYEYEIEPFGDFVFVKALPRTRIEK